MKEFLIASNYYRQWKMRVPLPPGGTFDSTWINGDSVQQLFDLIPKDEPFSLLVLPHDESGRIQ